MTVRDACASGIRAWLAFVTVPLAAAAVALPYPAAAQGLEEIVVTARKREESLQQTPVSVTAFDAGDIAALSAADIAALGQHTPNMNLTFSQGNSGGSNLGATIRGVGQFDFLVTTDPGVGVYLDGVYLGRTSGAVLDLLDVERVEVLRGPQGTVFGKNTIGGAINVVTRRPGDEFDGQVTAIVGDESRADGRLLLRGPLSDTVGASLALAANNRDGYVTRPDGESLGDIDQRVARAALEWRPGAATEVLVTADHTRQRQNSAPSLLAEVNPAGSVIGLWNAFVADPQPITAADATIATDFFGTGQTGTNRNDLDVTGVSAVVDVDVGDAVTFRSVTGWRDLEAVFGRDGDNTAAQYVHTENTVAQDQLSQELQLIGTAERFDWLGGLYYFREDASDFNRPRLASGLFAALEALPAPLGPPGAPCAAPFVAPGCAGNPINVALDLDLNVTTAQEVSSLALFGNVDYRLNERWTLNLGLRWTDEEKDFVISSFREGSGAVILPPGTAASDSWSELSYRAGLTFEMTDRLMYYASVSRGFKSGGFNGRPTAAFAVDSYDPEFITAYEIGLKSDLLNDRLRINAAAFFNDYEDIQLLVRSADPVTGAFQSILQNAAEASVSGFEAEATALLGAGWTLSLGVGYLDDEYDDIGNAEVITEDSELFQTPEWNVNLSARYERTLAAGAVWAARVDYAHTSSYFQDAANTRSIEEDGYDLVNLRTGYRSPAGAVDIALFLTNALDEEYIVAGGEALATFGTAEYTPARGREWGLSFSYNF